MKYLQDYAEQKGLGKYKLALVAQLHTENGAWSEKRRGDGGCSVGLSQLNICARRSIRNHPKLFNWKWQIEVFVDEIKANFDKYGNIERAQLGWNNPRAMRNNLQKNYTKKINKMKEIFSEEYYKF